MPVDVLTEAVLDHPRDVVAAFAVAAIRRANRKDLLRLADVLTAQNG